MNRESGASASTVCGSCQARAALPVIALASLGTHRHPHELNAEVAAAVRLIIAMSSRRLAHGVPAGRRLDELQPNSRGYARPHFATRAPCMQRSSVYPDTFIRSAVCSRSSHHTRNGARSPRASPAFGAKMAARERLDSTPRPARVSRPRHMQRLGTGAPDRRRPPPIGASTCPPPHTTPRAPVSPP